MRSLCGFLLLMGFALTLNTEGAQGAPDPENLLVMELEHGTVVIEMLPDLAPKHVARIRELTREECAIVITAWTIANPDEKAYGE